MENIFKKLEVGVHIIALPIDKEYKLDELFSFDLAGSFIEKLDLEGNFTQKEKIVFKNNEFVISENYKTLMPFETIRLTLKRAITINWQISFKSNTLIKNEELNLNSNSSYDNKKALMLMQLCSLVYDKQSNIKEKIFEKYKFDDFFYFSKQSHKNLMNKGFMKLFYILLKSSVKVVDLQFIKLSRFDETLNKEVIVFVFQGSKEKEDWMTNITAKRAKFFGKEQVHKGFYDSMQLFLRTIKTKRFANNNNDGVFLHKDIKTINENCKIILAGHSLGGAIATLVGCYFSDIGIKKENIDIYTFGAPPIGTKEFCNKYKNKVDLFRVVNKRDIVPKVDKLTNLKHFGQIVELESNENEIHSCNDYIDNIIDSIK